MSSLYEDTLGTQTLEADYLLAGAEFSSLLASAVFTAQASHIRPGEANVSIVLKQPGVENKLGWRVPSAAVADKYAELFTRLAEQMRSIKAEDDEDKCSICGEHRDRCEANQSS